MPFKEIIAELTDNDRPLRNTTLSNLSDLNAEAKILLEQAWSKIEQQRRRQILNRLVEMTEDNPEFNFNAVFLMCLKDSDAAIRAKAVEGLWEYEEPLLIDYLSRMLHEDPSQTVQAAAAQSLGKFAMLAELGKLRPTRADQVAKSLTRILDDKNRPVEVRRRALESAGPLSIPQVKNAIKGFYECGDNKLKASAIYAMGKNCDPAWLPSILNELASDINELRYEAAGACGEIGDKAAVPYLIQLVTDKDIDIQLASVQSLAKIGGPDAKKCLKKCLLSPYESIREAARQGILEIEAEEVPVSFPIRPH